MRAWFASDEKDALGRIVLGGREPKCPYCGTVQEHVSENGKVVFRHPGVTCCETACERQVRFRDDDLANLDAEWRKRKADLMARRAKDDSPAFQESIDRAYTVESERMGERVNAIRKERAEAVAALQALRDARNRPNVLPYKEAP